MSKIARPGNLRLARILLFCILHTVLLSSAQQRMEEFNGPFASWANVKTRFGAKGDGKTDDTKALQRALDSLTDRIQGYNSGNKAYTTVYIPRGKYIITATLVLRGKIGIRIVGEDPAVTNLIWRGGDNDTMFWANGSAYFSLSRVSWDAGDRKGVEAVGLHWKSQWNEPANRSYAPEQVEFTDLFFGKGFKNGISGGTFGGNDGTGMNESEITIKRCSFNECTESGILIRGFNALDYWIWHCRFIKCKVGVTSKSGNYHIYKSYFEQSGLSDVFNVNSYYTSVRFCFSVNSSAFSMDDGGSSNPFKRIFEGNTVTGLTNIGIMYAHTGKITLLDNVFTASPAINTKKFLEYGSWSPSHFDLLDLNNRKEGFSNVFSIKGPSRVFTMIRTFGSQPAVTSEAFKKSMPSAPPFIQRVVFDIPVNSNTSQIQTVINKASALKKRAVVHFPFCVYNLTEPLVIPINSDIQLVGDGYLYASVLVKTPSKTAANGAVLRIICPTTASVQHLSLDLSGQASDNGRAIALINADQQGSSVIMDQLYADNDTSLLVNDYNYTIFQKTNSFFTTGNYVAGGNLVEKGGGTMVVRSFGSQFANTWLEHNATFIARDCWWEGAAAYR